MNSSNTIVTLALLAAAALALGAIVAALSRPGISRYRLKPVMTPNEIEFYARIRRALPEIHVFPQVAMSALLEPVASSRKAKLASFRKISQKRVDYALCDGSMNLVAVIELDDRTHNAAKDAVRDAMFRTAGIPTLRFQSKTKPTEAQLVAAFMEAQAQRTPSDQRKGAA